MIKPRLVVIVLLLAILATPIVALASDITNARWFGVVQISNNSTAETNVATTANISTPSLIAGNYISASANFCAMRNSSGADVEFMPGYSDNVWCMWVPTIGANSILSYILYTAESTGGEIRYFPGDTGMVTPDDASMEPGDNFTIETIGFIETSTDNESIVSKTGAFGTIISAAQEIRSSIGIYSAEDLTGYTEVDANNKLTVSATTATAVDADRDEDVYLYMDYGANFFNGLDIGVEILIDSGTLANGQGGMAITNTVGSFNDFAATDMSVQVVDVGASNSIYLYRGKAVASDFYPNAAFDTPFYCTLTRAAGNDAAQLRIYSDQPRAVLLDTLNVAGYGAATRYRYAYGFVNYNAPAAGQDFTGYVKDLDISASPGVAVSVTASGVASGDHIVRTLEQPVLEFNGTNTTVIADAIANNIETDTIGTISTWLYFPGTAAGDCIVSITDISANTYLRIQFEGGATTRTSLRDAGADRWEILTTDNITINEWHLLTLVQNGTEPIVYIDGVAVAQSFNISNNKTLWLADIGAPLDGFTIGALRYNAGVINYFSGNVSDVRYYDTNLSAGNVLALYNGTFTDTTNLVGRWDLSEGTGTKAHEPFNNHNGTIANGTWGNEVLRISIDDLLRDIQNGESVLDNANDWIVGYNGTALRYMLHHKQWVDGALVQHIPWEYGATFSDLSGSGNDSTPSFRTASSDPDVSANMSSFSPVAEARAPDFVLATAPPFISAAALTGNITGTFNVTPAAGTFPLAGVIVAVANATNTPAQIPLLIIAAIVILSASLLMSRLMREQGVGSLIVKIITITAVMGIFIALGNFGIDLWMLVVFLILSIAMAMGSRQLGWT